MAIPSGRVARQCGLAPRRPGSTLVIAKSCKKTPYDRLRLLTSSLTEVAEVGWSTEKEQGAVESEADVDPDLECLDRIAAGDTDAFTELVRRHESQLRGTVLGIVADREICEDVLQEVFLIAYRRLETFRREAPFGAWIYRVAVREALRARTRWRTKWRRWVSIDEIQHLGQDPSSAESESVTEAEDSVLPLLAKLSARERAAIVLHGVEEKTYDEIAEVLGCTSGTVGSLIHRGRAKLEELMRIHETDAASQALPEEG